MQDDPDVQLTIPCERDYAGRRVTVERDDWRIADLDRGMAVDNRGGLLQTEPFPPAALSRYL